MGERDFLKIQGIDKSTPQPQITTFGDKLAFVILEIAGDSQGIREQATLTYRVIMRWENSNLRY